MGLDVSHDAFSGPYSAFNRFRQAVAKAMGGSYPDHEDKSLEPNLWYWGPGYNADRNPGLHEFFNHSDCDGQIHWRTCGELAEELVSLLPKLDEMGMGSGRIADAGGYGAVARCFIAGCKLAFDRKEDMEFA